MTDDEEVLRAALEGHAAPCIGPVAAVEAIAGDASTRRFFRVRTAPGTVVVAALYPDAERDRAVHDLEVQRWAREHGLPVAAPLSLCGRVLVMEDLGDRAVTGELQHRGEDVLRRVLEAVAVFQRCPWRGAPNPPFDAAFFRRELEVFADMAGLAGDAAAARYLDDLCHRLADHPYRLTHRDYHADNLLWRDGRVWAVDVQDLRGGPDTYDVASLLRERAGGEMLADDLPWAESAAGLLDWDPGWRGRYLECAAQRGLKVIGTFLRLAAAGRRGYLDFLPAVRRRAAGALEALGAPRALCAAARGEGPGP